ncbi:MAG: hypothetical protein HY721_01605 [Planctomycetes bacterium]|nr:hypothetical protein [Planctomycetota bacterium]
MMRPAGTRIVRIAGEGSFIAAEGLDAAALARIVEAHRANRDPSMTLKRNLGTLVTRVRAAGAGLEPGGAIPPELVVKEAPVPWRRRLYYRVGGVSPFARELEASRRLRERGVGAARVLASSLRPRGGTEVLVSERIDRCVPLRDLLWLGDPVVREPAALRALLSRAGAWLRGLHDAGVWQRDMKPSNVLVREGPRGFEDAELFLVDVAAVRLFLRPLGEARRVRNFAQLLDLTVDLDGEPRRMLLEAYAGPGSGDMERLERLERLVGASIEARRDHRERQCGFRHVDEEHRHSPK